MEWITGGGLPAKRPKDKKVGAVSPRRKRIRRAAKLMFFSGVLFPIFLVIGLVAEEPGPLIVPCILFFVGLVLMLYARLFSDDTPRAKGSASYIPAPGAQSPAIGSEATHEALPPAANASIPIFGDQRVRTNELAQPPSVTEHTTKLLDE